MDDYNLSRTPDTHRPMHQFIFNRQRVAALLLALFSGLFLFEASSYPYMDWIGPGSGFFPIWTGSLALASFLGLALLAKKREAAAAEDEGERLALRQGRLQVAITVAALIGAALLLEPLGFILTSGLFVFGLLWLYGSRPLTAILSGIVAGPVLYYLFLILHVRLPVGILGI